MSEYLESCQLPYRMGTEKAYSTDANVLGLKETDLHPVERMACIEMLREFGLK